VISLFYKGVISLFLYRSYLPKTPKKKREITQIKKREITQIKKREITPL
jgi:hypothetical protein